MRDRRNHRSLLGTDGKHLLHVRRVLTNIKPLANMLLQDARCKRPEFLAELDSQVDDIPHVGSPRVRNQRTIPKCPGSELHAALEPADHLSIQDQIGCSID